MSELLIVNGMEKIFPDMRPAHTLEGATMLKNERYSFQLAVFSMRELEHYRLSCDRAEGITLRKVEYAPCKRAGYDPDADDDYVIFSERADTYYPDILMPTDGRFISNGGNWTPFWVTVEGLPVGEHTLGFSLVNLATGETEGEASLSIKVIDKALPKLDIPYTTWFHYDCLADEYRLKVFSEPFNRVMNAYLANAVRHGMNTLYTPIFTPALDTKIGTYRRTVQLVDVVKEGENYEFDFSRLLAFMQNAERIGFTYFEMSHLATQWGAKCSPKVVATVRGRKRRIFGWDCPSLSPRYQAFLAQLLPKLVAFLDENGYRGRCFFHISDEPHEDHLEQYGKLSTLIRGLLNGYPVMDALSNYDFYKRGFVDIPVVATECTAPFEEDGIKNWVYYCCTQTFNGLSNRLFNMPLQRARVLGAQLYESGAKGFLHWGFNFYYSELSVRKINPFYETDADEKLPSGDCYIVYPAKDGTPYDSIRGEGLYDGVQDYCALKLLEELKGKSFTQALLASEGVKGYFEYPRSLEWHTAFREKINRILMEA